MSQRNDIIEQAWLAWSAKAMPDLTDATLLGKLRAIYFSGAHFMHEFSAALGNGGDPDALLEAVMMVEAELDEFRRQNIDGGKVRIVISNGKPN